MSCLYVSVVQLGSCTTDLSGLLRQGRDLSDLLLELPLLKDCSHDSTGPASALASVAGQSIQPQQHQQQGQAQLGTLVLRLISIGQEPRHSSGSTGMDTAVAAAPGTPGRKVSCMLD
jgi:nephrocystin-4